MPLVRDSSRQRRSTPFHAPKVVHVVAFAWADPGL